MQATVQFITADRTQVPEDVMGRLKTAIDEYGKSPDPKAPISLFAMKDLQAT